MNEPPGPFSLNVTQRPRALVHPRLA